MTRLQSTEYGGGRSCEGRAKVQNGLRPVQKWKGEVRGQSTDYGLRSAGGARERQLGWYVVPTLHEAGDDATCGRGEEFREWGLGARG